MQDGKHIIVVDDHRNIRDLVGKYLEQQGFRVSMAEGGGHCAVCWIAGPRT